MHLAKSLSGNANVTIKLIAVGTININTAAIIFGIAFFLKQMIALHHKMLF